MQDYLTNPLDRLFEATTANEMTGERKEWGRRKMEDGDFVQREVYMTYVADITPNRKDMRHWCRMYRSCAKAGRKKFITSCIMNKS